MTDGVNRTSTTTYDSRLRPLTYQIDGGVVTQSYEYYNDSSMRFVHNVSDSNFDRLYEYDQVGQLAYATTGGAARGDLGATPYFETFGYNAWGDTTSRFTETWSQNEFADAGSFTNGRRDGWGYEADGNIKTIDTRTYDYDAVGNRVLMTGQLWSGSNYFPTSTTNTYDGDARRVEEVLSWPSPFSTRYLRSSVLGGEIAQEINTAGQTISYVYLPDGTQLSTLIGFPKWRHETPAGTGLYENYQSGFVNRVEFDPVRANVGLTAPPPPDTNGGDGDIGGNHNGGPNDSRFSDIANPAAGCYNVGGVDLPCTWSIFDVFDFFVWTPARNATASASSDLPGRWVPSKRLVPLNVPNPFTQLLYPDDDAVPIGTNYIPGHWDYAPASFVNIAIARRSTTANPQDRPTIDNSDAKDQSCQIEVSFTGSFRDKGQLPNGPTVGYSRDRVPYYGIGFSVNISGISGNIVVRGQEKDPKPKGSWIVEQWVADYNVNNGKILRQDTRAHLDDLNSLVPAPQVERNSVNYWDHPGPYGNVGDYFTNRDFYIKAYNGAKHCEVAFRLTFSISGGQFINPGWQPRN